MRLSASLRAVLAVVAAAEVSCSLSSIAYLTTGNTNAEPDGAPADASTDDVAIDAGGCPGRAGPAMIDVGPFCIDSTEVTQHDYDVFMSAKRGDMSGQPAVCAGNTSYEPTPNVFTNPDWPASAIDWCDAVAYCTWAGKRLCGKIGGGSVFLGGSSYDDPKIDQWYYACTANGQNPYPYGASYDPSACAGANETHAEPVKTYPRCVGGFPGIFDMSGNVWEWEDACDDKGMCANRGGAFMHSTPGALACSHGINSYVMNRMDTSGDTGFRCCSP